MKLKKVLFITGIVLVGLTAAFFGLVYYGELIETSEPKIISVEFPDPILLNVETTGTLEFSDKEGDVETILFEDLDHSHTSVFDLLALGAGGLTRGTFEFSQLADDPQEALKRLVLVDHEGHRSAPYLFRYRAGDARDFYAHYDAEQTEQLPTTLTKKLHLFVVAGSATDFEKLPPDVTKNILTQSILPQINGISDQCGLAFEVATTSIIRLQDLKVKDARTYNRLFTVKEGEQMLLIRSYEEGISWFDGAAKALAVPKDDIAVFIMGYPIWHAIKNTDIDGHGGSRSAIFTWRHVYITDEAKGGIVIPKLRMSVMAHELGHVLGLLHPVDETSIPRSKFDRYNLMTNTKDMGSDLIPEQCKIIRAHL